MAFRNASSHPEDSADTRSAALSLKETGVLDAGVPSFDSAVFHAGTRVGTLPGHAAARLVAHVEALLKGLSELEDAISRLKAPECRTARASEAGSRARLYMTSGLDRRGSLVTELHLSAGAKSDFLYDPRRKVKNWAQRPGSEVFHLPGAIDLASEQTDSCLEGLKSEFVGLIVAAHRRAWERLNEHFEVALVSEPILAIQGYGRTTLAIDDSGALAARREVRATAMEAARQTAVLAAFAATFPKADPIQFVDTYREGKRRGWRSARISQELASIGAPANANGNVSSGLLSGSRRFEYSTLDLAGAVKQIEHALDATRPDWRSAPSDPMRAPIC